METYKKREDPSSPSSDGSFSSVYAKPAKRSENDRKRARYCMNDNSSRGLDCYRKDSLDNKTTNKFFNTKRSVNEEQADLNIRDPNFMEPNALPSNSCATSMQSIPEMQVTPHSNNVVGSMFPFIGMQPQPNVSDRMDILGFHQYDGGTRQEGVPKPAKEVLYFTNCTLFPPSSFCHLPPFRQKPIGCNMIAVLGLPEKTTEEMVKEIFEYFGPIITVIMNSFSLCHICFTHEDSVDRALCYSGYVIMIEDKEEKVYRTKTIYIEYATSFDSCTLEHLKQRYFSSVGSYSKEEATIILKKLKEELDANIAGDEERDEHSFYEALHVLNGWLARGECVKSNADEFNAMINTVQRLSEKINSRKSKYLDKKNEAEHALDEQVRNNLRQFTVISNFFRAVKQQKVWDHFSKAQRKNIEKWQEEFEDLKNVSNNELLQQRVEDDMDISDDETEDFSEQTNNLEEELMKLLDDEKSMIEQLKQIEIDKEKIQRKKTDYENRNNKVNLERETTLREGKKSKQTVVASHNDCNTSIQKQMQSISLISTFLSAHHFGANIDYICSYLQQFDSTLKARDIESLMKRFPTVFNENRTGIGASLETKWTFCDFKPQ